MKCVHDAVAAALLLFCSSSYFSLFVHSYSFFVGAAAITVDLCKQAHRLQLLAPFHFDGLLLPPLPTPPPSFFSFSFLRDRQNDCLVLLLVFLLLLLFANSKNTTIYASSPAKEKNEWREARLRSSVSIFPSLFHSHTSSAFFHILSHLQCAVDFLFLIPHVLKCVRVYVTYVRPGNFRWTLRYASRKMRVGAKEWERGKRHARTKFDRKSLLMQVLCIIVAFPATVNNGMLQIQSYLRKSERA